MGLAHESPQVPKTPPSSTAKNNPIHLSCQYYDKKHTSDNMQARAVHTQCKRRDTMVDCCIGA